MDDPIIRKAYKYPHRLRVPAHWKAHQHKTSGPRLPKASRTEATSILVRHVYQFPLTRRAETVILHVFACVVQSPTCLTNVTRGADRLLKWIKTSAVTSIFMIEISNYSLNAIYATNNDCEISVERWVTSRHWTLLSCTRHVLWGSQSQNQSIFQPSTSYPWPRGKLGSSISIV